VGAGTVGAVSEREDLIGIYGAIDRCVQRNPELTSTVAPFLPGYGDGGAVGWFDEFESWTRERAGTSPYPDFPAAVAHLARTPTSGRLAARRILVLAVAARLRDHLVDTDTFAAIESALAVDGIAGSDGVNSARSLVSLLVDDNVFAGLDQWPRLIETAVRAKVISADLMVQSASAPCSGSLVTVNTPGDPFPAAELRTTFSTTAVTFQQASRFLEPSNWPGCSSFWCEMSAVATPPGATRVYHEIVSLDCAHRNQTWTAEAYLDFALVSMTDGARLSYALSKAYTNTLIEVDEGWIAVHDDNPGVTVSTVKRIKFNHAFNGPSLAMVMCALGYGNIAEHLVLDCAVQNAQNPGAGTVFPGGVAPGNRTAPPPGLTAQKLKQCIDDCVDAYASACDKIAAGTFGADDFAKGMADMWSRSLRDAAQFAEVALQMVRTTRAPDPGASAEAGTDPSTSEG
jgi:hypothetical protein